MQTVLLCIAQTERYQALTGMNFSFLQRRPQLAPHSAPAALAGLELHCRLLPNLGDSPATTEESLEWVAAFFGAGFRRLLLTPHVMRTFYEFQPAHIRAATEALCEQAHLHHPGLRLNPAATYYTDEGLLTNLRDSTDILTFTGSVARPENGKPKDEHTQKGRLLRPETGSFVLIETAWLSPSEQWSEVLRRLRQRYCTPALARAERYIFLQQMPERANYLHQAGVRFQLDLVSLTGANGPAAQKLAHYLLNNGLVSFVGFYPAPDRFADLLRQVLANGAFRQLAGL
jgi:protein-tyrosine phosphatase